ncbi:hypothetical protein HPB52_003729 [Rhipicephalus sanguineus]|uniref:FHA domain-containing protein n=1 Tax=Rhipicephalus sanguineus TaxID=34632 RepID=A0A9D4Q4M3_RHISA|nr:hypothetical protein HPB52_003729 [Rhipicephalus sanguineus]
MVDAWRLVRCGSYTHAKSEIVLDCENVVIGRNVEPKYRLDSVNISRQHACLRYSRHGQWEITDLRSHNGVFVNGRKIQASHRFALHEGDIIGFGKPTPTGDDVFVFALEKKSASVVVKSESPDSPRAASPGLDAVVLSDDDDIVVTKVVIANRRPTVSTSSECALVASTPLTTTLPAAPPHVTTKKEPVDEDDSLGYGVSEALTSQTVGAAHIDVAATADTTRFKSSPRHQVTGTTFTTSSKTVPCEAAGRVKIERDCDSTDSRSSCSRDTQHSRLSVPVVLTAATNNSPTATAPALAPHAPRTYIKQEVPEHAAGIGSIPVCEPGDVSRFIKQDPDDLDREKARNVQRMVVTSAHQSKTHTLVGMVTEILHHNSRQTMLIVAPSNAAVDEIGRRLLAHRQQQYRQKVPTEQVLKVVRVGQTNKVHPEYQTSKLILVGDPMQLPATVMSQDAADRGFQESLFERFYNYLNQEADPKPIFTLNEQRRMHSEICWFPSNYFYGGKLRPVVGLDAMYAPFPLIPYLVFNIEDSPEATCLAEAGKLEQAGYSHGTLA